MASTVPNEDGSKVETNSEALIHELLTALQNESRRKIMDVVDKLRRIGLSTIIALPQLVVCGDQSSGKSSVLEGITGIAFPRKAHMCTRFATEVILRRAPESICTVAIRPDNNRAPSEQAELEKFNKVITDFSQIPNMIESAAGAMGLGEVGQDGSKAFSRDVLSIELSGPDRPHLSVVDLPGLIHATSKSQTQADKELVLDLVLDYMKSPRTIILAVVSAKNDFANQIILDHCRNIDKNLERTVGVITKPDYLLAGSHDEAMWIELAQNNNIHFLRGWHMVKNRADNEMQLSFAERNQAEKDFFSKGRYMQLPRAIVGIDTLRERLSDLLVVHLRKELPLLVNEVADKLSRTKAELEALGVQRTTPEQQRMMLMEISMRSHDILKSAIRGNYGSSFLGFVNMDSAVDATDNIHRFRAVVQHLNLEFADTIRQKGSKFRLRPVAVADNDAVVPMDISEEEGDDADKESGSITAPEPQALTHDEAIAWVKKILERSRGSELPGIFNPLLVAQLFWELSQPWEAIAQSHIELVASKCKKFVELVLQHTSSSELTSRLVEMTVGPALENALTSAKEELRKVIEDKSRDPMTYNHYFTTTVQKNRKDRQFKVMKKAQEHSRINVPVTFANRQTYLDPQRMDVFMKNSIEQDMDTFSAEEALSNARAYYKDEMKYFINTVCKAVVERHLIAPLPDLISPLVFTKFTDEQINFVASEDPSTTMKRTNLEYRKKLLQEGLKSLREAARPNTH